MTSPLRKPFSALTSLARPPAPGTRRFAAWNTASPASTPRLPRAGGRLLGSFDGNPVLPLHHLGRRSGEPRVTPLLYQGRTQREIPVVILSPRR